MFNLIAAILCTSVACLELASQKHLTRSFWIAASLAGLNYYLALS